MIVTSVCLILLDGVSKIDVITSIVMDFYQIHYHFFDDINAKISLLTLVLCYFVSATTSSRYWNRNHLGNRNCITFCTHGDLIIT